MSEQEIQDWLKNRVAKLAEVAPEAVDVTMPFSSFGLTSIDAVEMSADLEDMLHLKLSPILTWDYPCIEKLAKHLAILTLKKAG